MNLDDLKTLLIVARQGSFAAAARTLDVDPSSVSRLVAGAEEQLGLRLFQRTTRRLSVTEEGDVFFRRIRPVLEELDQAREEALALRNRPAGNVRLTASVAFTQECILPHLSRFRAQWPEISLEILATDAVLDLLADDIDLAIRLVPAPEGDIVSARLMRTRYRVCASPDWVKAHPTVTKPSDLQACDCLRFAMPDYRARWLFRDRTGSVSTVPVDGTLLITNALSLREAACRGLGPALLADWLVRRDLEAGRLVDLFPGHDATATEFDTGAWALYPSRSYLPHKVRVTLDFLRSCLSLQRA